jgi:hypothetical protein
MLGARGAQLARPLVMEAALLALMGGVAGLALGWTGVRLLHTLGPADLPRLADIQLDWLAVALAAALALVAAMVLRCSALAYRARAVRRTIAGDRQHARGRAGCAQIVGSRALIGTSLLASFVLFSADRGCHRSCAVVHDMAVTVSGWCKRLQLSTHARSLQRSRCRGSGMGSALPMADDITSETADVVPTTLVFPGERSARGIIVWPTYFSTLGMNVQQGRAFELTMTLAPLHRRSSTRFVRRYFNGGDPVGRTIKVGLMGRPTDRLIVGVIEIRGTRLDAEPEPVHSLVAVSARLAHLHCADERGSRTLSLS